MNLNLQGKVAIVTGSSKGIGRAIAEEFGAEGARVSICARNGKDLAAALEELKRQGFHAIATVADVTRADDVVRVVDATVNAFGGIDILVNNAGDIAVGRSIATSVEQWRETLETNLISAVCFPQAGGPPPPRGGGGGAAALTSALGHTPSIPRCIELHYST